MDPEVAIFLVVLLLTSSLATVTICCLELKAVWKSYKETKLSLESEPECTCSNNTRHANKYKNSLELCNIPESSRLVFNNSSTSRHSVSFRHTTFADRHPDSDCIGRQQKLTDRECRRYSDYPGSYTPRNPRHNTAGGPAAAVFFGGNGRLDQPTCRPVNI